VNALREVIGALREQLTAANTRADQAEARAERADGRADKAEQGREAERTRVDAAEARAAGLQTLLDAAEARAAAMEKAEAERAAWSRWRRLREALRGSDVRAIMSWLSAAWHWYAAAEPGSNGPVYPHAGLVNPLAAGIGAALLIGAAVQQALTARRRHEQQTKADLQRRITESFSKAVEQLGSDKLEVRLGGVYSLERISKESPDDYWTVMENLAAFVRERSRRNEAERTALDLEQRVSRRAYFLWREAGRLDERGEEFWAEAVTREELGEPPAADVAAVLTAITRRSERGREREKR